MPSKRQKKILKECMLLSSCVYNMTNYVIRQQFFNKDKISSFYTLQQQIQNKEDYQLLGRSYALPRIQLYAETNSARFKLIKSKTQEWVGLPKYYKNRKTNTTISSYLVIDGCQYSIKKNHIIIPLSNRMRKRYKVGKQFRIKYKGILKWKGKQARGRIHLKDNRFYFHQSIELGNKRKVKSKIKAGLDLGIKRKIAIRTLNNQDLLIGNKRSFKQWKYMTDLIAELQSQLKTQHNKHSSKRISKLFSKRKKYLNNLFDNYVAKTFRFLNRNNVSELIIGDIKGILQDLDWGKKQNQKTHNYWSYDLLLQKIKNKAEEKGIKIIMETEEYTSRTCPICGDNSKSNCKDRIFVCSFCEYIDHRDLIGAGNIMFKSMRGSTQSTHWSETTPLEATS